MQSIDNDVHYGEHVRIGAGCVEAWIYETECDCQPFARMPEFCRERVKIGKEGAGIVLKLGSNSVYGKLAQSVGGSGTVPSLVVEPSTNLGMAFQANTGHLWLAQINASALNFVSVGDQGLTMKAGTSPSLAETPAGDLEVALQGSNGDLWLEINGTGNDQFLGMAPGTSPSLVVLPDGKTVTAFQANTTALWIQQNGAGFSFHPPCTAVATSSRRVVTAVSPAKSVLRTSQRRAAGSCL
jgi:hypothetical protein